MPKGSHKEKGINGSIERNLQAEAGFLNQHREIVGLLTGGMRPLEISKQHGFDLVLARKVSQRLKDIGEIG